MVHYELKKGLDKFSGIIPKWLKPTSKFDSFNEYSYLSYLFFTVKNNMRFSF
jgi:hypothetical protein